MDTSTPELISKLIKAQEESDERLMKLEEKRLEFEERQLEKEAQQRKEERQFQLRMMQLVMGQGLGPPPAHFDTSEPFGENSMDDRMYTFQPTEDIDNCTVCYYYNYCTLLYYALPCLTKITLTTNIMIYIVH